MAVVVAATAASTLAAVAWAGSGSTTFTVAADGSGQYTSLQAAVDAVPADGTAHTIVVAKGTYPGTVVVPAAKTKLTIKGATGDPADVVITAGHASGTAKPGGGTYGTEGSATATFHASDLTVTGVSIVNSFDPAARPSVTDRQAVALAAEGDRQVYTDDRFVSTQDTLLAWSPKATAQTRQYFRNSYIAGTVDFIFGNATAVFDHVTIDALSRGAKAGGVNGYLTAANTDSSHAYGFLITDSTVTSTAAAATEYLGRPWHPTATSVAQVVVRNTTLPAAVKTTGPWTDMSGFSWKHARFFEYRNTGPGASVNAHRPQLSDEQAATYTARAYLAGTDGWDPTATSSPSVTPSSSSSTSTGNGSGAAAGSPSPVAGVTGDSRQVSEPVLPETCATVAASLTLTGRTGSSAQEQAPPDTARIQQAIDGCTHSGDGSVAVKLVAGTGTDFLSGPLTVKQGVVLVLDSPVTLFAARNPALYQVSGSPTCGTIAAGKGGCAPFLAIKGSNSGIEGVRAADGTQGRIDGRGDLTILGGSGSWWALARQAQVQGGNQQAPRLVQASSSNNVTVYHVDLVNSPNFHLVFANGTGFTVWGIRIKTPAGARNTDGIDPGGATDVTIRDSYVATGDDGIAIKGGRTTKNVTVFDNHFYGTHGISIGSETNAGVSNVLVENNTVDGTDPWGTASVSSSGIRIKSSLSNGGPVTDVAYSNTCVQRVKAPIVFDTHYSGGTGSKIPSFTRITVDGLVSTASASGATSVFAGIDAAHPLGVSLNQVRLDTTKNTAQYATITAAGTNLTFTGTGVSVTSGTATGSLPTCSFPDYPAL